MKKVKKSVKIKKKKSFTDHYPEAKHYLPLVRKHLGRQMHAKLKGLKDSEDFHHTARFALVSFLEKKYRLLEKEVEKKEQKGKDVFFVRNQLCWIPGKIAFMKAYGGKEEFYKALRLLNRIEKELKTV